MSRSDADESGDDRPDADEAYENWGPPGTAVDGSGQDDGAVAGSDDWPAPSKLRKPLLRDRIRDRLGVTPRQWYVVESLLLVLPYPLFVYAYLTLNVDETLFLVVTGLYSLLAMYVGFLS